MFIEENTEISFYLKNRNDIPEVEEQTMRGYNDIYDLMVALEGYEFTPEDMAQALQAAYEEGMISLRSWKAGRQRSDDTLDCIAEDVWGNKKILTISVSEGFPGNEWSLYLKGANGISFAIENMLSSPAEYGVYDLKEDLYECGWDGEAMRELLEDLSDNGQLHEKDWWLRRETPVTIAFSCSDPFGNVHIFKVRR